MQDLNLFKLEADFVPIEKENEFYDITDERFQDKINSEVVIAELTRKVLKVMACKQSWIDKYYEEPLKEYENSPKEEKKGEKKSPQSNFYYGYPKECVCCGCTCGDCCCNYDCDGPCERCCCCCGIKCPRIEICDSNICPDETSCRCFSNALAVIFWTLVFGSCFISCILGCVGVFNS